MTRRNKIIFIAIFCWVFMALPSAAQIKVNYHFGFIGTTGDTTGNLNEAVLIGYNKCFDITNGLSKFNFPKSGAFAIACNEDAPAIALLVHAYPNPVIDQLTIRSLVIFPEKDLTKYRLVITSFEGKVIRQIKTDIASINAGFVIRMNDLPMGYFIVTLHSDKELIQSFKIFKAS